MKPKISLCIFIIYLTTCYSKNLPSFIKKCKREYPEVNKCLLQRVQDLKPYLIKGIPEMNIPAIKPLRIPEISIETGNGTATQLTANFTDIIVEGAENIQIKELDFDLRNEKNVLNSYIPALRIRATYSFKGNLLFIELNSEGPSDLNITDVYTNTVSTIKVITKDGKKYVDVGNEKPTITYARPSVRFDNLFKGNPQLTENTNKVLNDNIDEIQKDIKPLIDETVHIFIIKIIKTVFDEYSIDELFD